MSKMACNALNIGMQMGVATSALVSPRFYSVMSSDSPRFVAEKAQNGPTVFTYNTDRGHKSSMLKSVKDSPVHYW